jgi:hypothetical protein
MVSRSPSLLSLVVLLSLTALVACSTRGGRPAGGFRDGGPYDGSRPPVDGSLVDFGGPVNVCAPACGPTELCGDTGEGNGLDDNCNGSVDEGCLCSAQGITQPCFNGPPDRRNIGACSDGLETCNEFRQWSACIGGVGPSVEVCDGADNDCNNITDEGLSGCSSAVTCPGSENAPPLSNFPLRGGRVYGGTGTNWRWTVECPASVPAALCPAPTDPAARDTSVYFTASGAYRVSVQVTTDDGLPAGCAWTVYVQGSGLRVELNWDTMLDTAGGVDMDLHLHRWTQNGEDTPWYGDDDCYYGNCQPESSPGISWPDHANTTTDVASVCGTAPHGGGATWTGLNYCRNPRLDVDTNGTDGACSGSVTDPQDNAFCAPENINVDAPIVGMPYRVMVNHYDSGAQTMPTVNIYCGGALRGAFGTDPFVQMNGTSSGGMNDNWFVADVVFFQGTCGMDCNIYPLGTMLARAPDFLSELPFGPAWSCNYDQLAGTCTP